MNKAKKIKVTNVFVTKFGMGNTLKDIETGFKGKVVAIITYKNSETQYLIQPKLKDPGSYPSATWIVEKSLQPTK